MNASQIYIAIAIVVLAVIAVLVFVIKGKKPEAKLSKLATLAFAFIAIGIIFGENRLVGYSLLGIGVILAITDMFRKTRK